MSDLDRLHAPNHARFPRYLASILVAPAAAMLFASGLMTGRFVAAPAVAPAATAPAAPAADPCALPPGIEFQGLSQRDRGLIAQRAVLCSDRYHERISPAEYAERLHAIDARLLARDAAAPPAVVWASSVSSMSSQYTADSWSAARVLGAPDVFPQGGDNVNAWASLSADGGVEHLEVGFDRARPLRGVEVLETLAPGAVTSIELIGTDGERATIYQGAAAAMSQPSFRRVVDGECSGFPVASVRVTLDSKAVPGWNEIDAIGAHPCD